MESLEALIAAIRRGDCDAVALLLDREPGLVNGRTTSGDSPLLVAAYSGAASVVELLRARGAIPDIFTAAATGDVSALGSLIDEQPSRVQSFAHDGWTPLHLAAFFGRPEAARLLLERGADVLARSGNATANQPLHAAAVRGQLDLVELLLTEGAELNECAEGGYTPLLLAAAGGYSAVVATLLGRGANPDARDQEGRSARDHARLREHQAVLALLTPPDGAAGGRAKAGARGEEEP